MRRIIYIVFGLVSFFMFTRSSKALIETPSSAYSIGLTSFERCRLNIPANGSSNIYLNECSTFTPQYNHSSSFGVPTNYPYVLNRFRLRFQLAGGSSFSDTDTYTINFYLNTKNVPRAYFEKSVITLSGGVNSYCDNCGKINILSQEITSETSGGYFVTITFQTMLTTLKYITVMYDSPIANNHIVSSENTILYGIDTSFQFGISNFSMAYEKSSNSLLNQQINQNQTIINQNNQTNQTLTNINGTLNDDTPPNADISGLGNVQGLLPPGPVDSLLNIPAQFLSIVTSSLSGSCKPLSGTWVYDQPLTFPCFDQIIWKDFKDKTLLNFLELIPCGFILIVYFKHLYKKVERATSLESNSDDEWGVI